MPMKILVTWYSRTGTTRAVGQALARELSADSEEIIDLKKRTGLRPFRWLGAGRDAMTRKLTSIKFEKSPEAYDLIVVGTPVWAGNVTPAVRSYLSSQRLDGKKLAFFCTGGGKAKLFEDMTGLTPKAAVLGSLSLAPEEVKRDRCLDKVKEFADSLRK